MFEVKNYRGVMCQDTEGLCNIYRRVMQYLQKGYAIFTEKLTGNLKIDKEFG